MIRLRHKLLLHAFRVLDQLILIAVLLAWYLLLRDSGHSRNIGDLLWRNFDGHEILQMSVLATGWYLVFASTLDYQANRFTSLTSQTLRLIKANTLATFLLFVVLVTFGRRGFSNVQIVLFWVTSIGIGIFSRVAMRFMLTRLRRSGKNSRHILFIGTNEKAIALARKLAAKPELGCRIKGFLAEAGSVETTSPIGVDWPILGTTLDTRKVLEHDLVDEVMICLPVAEHFLEIYEMVGLCQERGVVVRIRPTNLDVKILSTFQVESFEGENILTFFRERLLGQLLAKRLLDVLMSSGLLIVLSPAMLLVALLIKLETPGPILFSQERIGMNKRRFKLLKFRSMVADAETKRAALEQFNEMDGPVFKIANDPRITRVGRVLRHTSIDELPQLINVLKGDMSLVGPRPPLPSEVDKYEWFDRKRISIMPGITCLWQISGRNDVSFHEWMELDRKYVETWSVWLDLAILLKTIPVVLFGKGAR